MNDPDSRSTPEFLLRSRKRLATSSSLLVLKNACPVGPNTQHLPGPEGISKYCVNRDILLIH